MQRVLIIGISGAGKTTLATQMSQKLGLPLFHLDKLFWLPNWQMPEMQDWQSKVQQLAQQDSWIVDGNYANTNPILMPRADTIIYFDFSRMVSLYRVLKRYFSHRVHSRPDLPEGCRERVDWEFIKYIWHFPKDRRPIIEEALEEFGAGKRVIRIRSAEDLAKLSY